MDCIDDIREATARYSAPSAQVVDSLLAARWCTEELLEVSFEQLHSLSGPSVAAFFQLPGVIKLPPRWIDVDMRGRPPSMLRFEPIPSPCNQLTEDGDSDFQVLARRSFGGLEEFRNAWIPGDTHGTLLRTQVVIVFELWGTWLELNESYESARALQLPHNQPLPFRGHHAKRDKIPITVSNFPVQLAKWIASESIALLGVALPSYAKACLEIAPPVPTQLASFFTLMQDGRVSTLGAGRSLVADAARPFAVGNYGRNLGRFMAELRNERSLSIYEHYLQRALRQAHEGEPALAVVMAVMVLDWFANEMIRGHLLPALSAGLSDNESLHALAREKLWPAAARNYGARTGHLSTSDKLLVYLPAISRPVRGARETKLKALLTARNSIVHASQATAVPPGDAVNHVATAMDYVAFILESILKPQRPR